MQFPYFYISLFSASQQEIELDEENSRHAIQVLRLSKGKLIHLTDGRGHLITAEIIDDYRKKCIVRVQHSEFQSRPAQQITLAISLLKNRNRFEWLLEKVTELGVTKIIPLLCEHTEKEKGRMDRMEAVLISALLQSRQVWLPELTTVTPFSLLRQWKLTEGDNYIAYCGDAPKKSLGELVATTANHSLICIGPEGDFSPEEYSLAIKEGFFGVNLGQTRLRTETAGIAAVSLLSLRGSL